jgi:hypothetical protein
LTSVLTDAKILKYNLSDVKIKIEIMTKKAAKKLIRLRVGRVRRVPVTAEVLPDLISQAEAARMRQTSTAAIADLVKRGRLAIGTVGGRNYVLKSEVKGFQDERFKEGEADERG